jgi:nucleoid-associated protein YgaU
VREGDSLWTIAADELGAGATNTAIARRWPQWYAANARAIGDDPDLLLPGQVLRAPSHGSDTRTRSHKQSLNQPQTKQEK